MSNERPVIVTTSYRGVFFGYASHTDGKRIFLRNARMCIYWSTDLRGFMGLAKHGPNKHCKIGPAADVTLRGITAVVEVTPEAVVNWEKAPWGE